MDVNCKCVTCRWAMNEPAHISAHPEDDYPGSSWCEENMDENFGTEGGCWKYEEAYWVE